MGLFGKKKDFWDEVDTTSSEHLDVSEDDEYEDEYEDDGRWHPTKSVPLKFIARLLMFISVIVCVGAGYMVYTYFSSGGSWNSKPDYFQSSYFGKEYNQEVEKVLDLVSDIESKGTAEGQAEAADAELIKKYFDGSSNFSFVVYNANDDEVVSSSEDAVKRIEASKYFTKLDSSEGTFSISAGVNNDAFDESAWKTKLMNCQNGYTIYTAVDNELTSTTDGFYSSNQEFEKLGGYVGIAKIALIAAGIIFVIMLIFSVVATGNVRGYEGVQLSWFDKIFTEIAIFLIVILAGASIYGANYLLNSSIKFGKYAAIGALVLAYFFIVRGYFSMVRRIKAGRFAHNMIFYHIFNGIGKLPAVLRVLLMIIVLILINGGLVAALFMLDGFELGGIPVVYIVVPALFIMENISFITWIIGKGSEDDEYDDDEDEDEYDDDDDEAEDEAAMALSGDTQQAIEHAQPEAAESADHELNNDWEDMDLGASVDAAIQNTDEGEEAIEEENESGHTVLLPQEELNSIIGGTGAIHESATSFDFIQLNKDIRKLHRSALKEQGIAVTMRAPEKPIVLEMNKEDMWKAVSVIFDNLEQYAEPDSRVYAEMYTQKGRLIYVVKNAIREDALEQARAVTAPGAELSGGLKISKEIIEKNKGKFVVAMDGNIFKTGILLSITRD